MKKRMKKLTAILLVSTLTLSGSAAVSAGSVHVNLHAALGTYGKVLAALAMDQEASWLDHASLDLVVTTADKIAFKLDALLNDTLLTTVTSYTDLEKEVLFLDGICSSYLMLDLEELLASSGLMDEDNNLVIPDTSGITSLTEEQLQTLTGEYLPILQEACEIGEGSLDKVQVGDIVNEVSDIHFSSTKGKAAGAMHEIAGMLLEDEELLNTILSAGNVDQDEVMDALEEIASDDFINDLTDPDTVMIEGDICLDTDGVFTAIYTDVNAEDDHVSMSLEIPNEGSKQAIKAVLDVKGSNQIVFDAALDSGEGEFALTVDGQSAVSGLFTSESSETTDQGELTLLAGDLISSSIGVEGGSLVLSYEIDKESGVFNGTAAVYVDTNDVITLSLTADANADDLEIPEDLSTLEPMIDLNDENRMEALATSLNFMNILTRLTEAGVPMETLFGGSDE